MSQLKLAKRPQPPPWEPTSEKDWNMLEWLAGQTGWSVLSVLPIYSHWRRMGHNRQTARDKTLRQIRKRVRS